MENASIGFIGAGQMATALSLGMIRSETLRPDQIIGFSPSVASRERFAATTGGRVAADNEEVVTESDVIFLAVKPQRAMEVLAPLSRPSTEKLFVSVIAGMPAATLVAALDTDRLIRTLPTTPCLVGKGIAALAGYKGATEQDLTCVESLLSPIAMTYRMDERQLDAVTAMANPAYVFQFIEALADGGVLSGLPREIAQQMATQNVLGAAAMVAETGEHPAVLKDQVASPAGTTIAGLQALECGGLRGTVMKAEEASWKRSQALGEIK